MKKLMKWSAYLGGGFIAAALAIVLFLGANRVVVIADTGGISGLTKISDFGELPGHEIALQEGKDAEMSLKIPVENAIGPENIMIENQYVGRRFVVFIRGATGFFYESSRITGYIKPVQAASYMVESEGVTLYLQLSELYEYESILNKGYLQVNLYRPSERYEKVVILDAEESDDLNYQEKEALAQIEKKCQALLEAEGIRIYNASAQSGKTDVDSKLTLVKESNASLYVGLMLAKEQDTKRFGSYVSYNSLYFRPWFSNGSFADKMERELVTAISGKALGLVEAEDSILQELSIPAVIVCPGYLSHETEGKLLMQDGYQDMIAEGICKGIIGAFEELEKV